MLHDGRLPYLFLLKPNVVSGSNGWGGGHDTVARSRGGLVGRKLYHFSRVDHLLKKGVVGA